MRNRTVKAPAHEGALCAENATGEDCIAQADICCEQARAAAKLKRFQAASGLFRTAQNLYQRAMSMGGEACAEARERMQRIAGETATYTDLAKSVARPARAVTSSARPVAARPIAARVAAGRQRHSMGD